MPATLSAAPSATHPGPVPSVQAPSVQVQGHRYGYLDAMRGVAALLVLVYHIGTRFGGPELAPNGYLAVDFFFILSGLVLASAYERKLGVTLSWGRFLRKRIIRLYPMVGVGVVIGAAYLVSRWHVAPGRSDPLVGVLAAAALNLALLPKVWWGRATTGETFPCNGALWSLFFEMLANLAWAAWLVRAGNGVIAALTMLGALVFVACALMHGSPDVGWNLTHAWGGIGRVTFGFLSGVLIYRHRAAFAQMPVSVAWLAPVLLVLCIFVKGAGIAWPLFGALVAMPAAVICGLAAGSRRLIPGEELLGRMSYPLYALHVPMLLIFSGVQKKLWPNYLIGPEALLLAVPIVLAALCFLILYDEPLRQSLDRRFG